MSHIKILILLAGILSLNNPSVFAQGAGIEWDTLHTEASRLHQALEWDRGKVLAERALAVAQQSVGPNHQDVAKSLALLARFYRRDSIKAEALYKRAFDILEKNSEVDSLSLAPTFDLLAFYYKDQGEYDKAKGLYRRSLKVFEDSYGSDHPDITPKINNLAGLYMDQGDFELAELLYIRSLAIRETALGRDHIDVAGSLSLLGQLHLSQGKYDTAIWDLERCIRIKEKTEELHSGALLVNTSQLLFLYEKQGQFDKAIHLAARKLASAEARVSSGVLISSTLAELAHLYRIQGDHDKAEALFKRALPTIEHWYGPSDSLLAKTLEDLATLYRTTNRSDSAQPLEVRASSIRKLERDQSKAGFFSADMKRDLAGTEKALGSDHHHLANMLDSFAEAYLSSAGDYATAEPLYKRSLAIKEKALGPNNPNVATSLERLASLYRATDRPDLAEPLEARAAKIRAIKR